MGSVPHQVRKGSPSAGPGISRTHDMDDLDRTTLEKRPAVSPLAQVHKMKAVIISFFIYY